MTSEFNFIALQASDNATRLGVAVLEMFGVFPDKNWFWIGSSAVLGFAVLFNILFTLVLMYLNRKNQRSFLCIAKLSSYILVFLVTSIMLFF